MNSIVVCALIFCIVAGVTAKQQKGANPEKVRLPKPRLDSSTSVEQALRERRSVREYRKGEALKLEEISQLLWAAQGRTGSEGYRTSPSAGALYPLELYVVTFNVRNLPAGIYHYVSRDHELQRITQGDVCRDLYNAALSQDAIQDASAVIVFSAVYSRTTMKYRERGRRYVHIEAGHASQNVYLQAVSLNLGTVAIGAFNDADVKRIVMMKDDEEPLYLMPVGRK